MKNHMNSPKIKKAIESAKQFEAYWLADNKELEAYRLAKPFDYDQAWINEHERRIHRNVVAFDLMYMAKEEAVRFVWLYYKGALTNREISDIVNNLFIN